MCIAQTSPTDRSVGDEPSARNSTKRYLGRTKRPHGIANRDHKLAHVYLNCVLLADIHLDTKQNSQTLSDRQLRQHLADRLLPIRLRETSWWRVSKLARSDLELSGNLKTTLRRAKRESRRKTNHH